MDYTILKITVALLQRFNEVGQTETHTAEPLVPGQSAFEVQLAIEKLQSHRSPGID